MEYVYLDLFSSLRRPQIHFALHDPLLKPIVPFCDSLLLIFRNWDSAGAGDFIPEPLGVDMLRAAAYRRAGVYPTMKSSADKLTMLQVRRVNKRRVLNEEELYQVLQQRFSDKVDIESKVLENESAVDQVKHFMSLDVLVAAHGAGLTNTIFMLPNSYLVELMPPYWYLACYRRLSENVNIGYVLIRSQGKKGPQCDKDPTSVICQRAGIRDRDFNVSIPKVVNAVESGISFVRRKKYKRVVLDVCSYFVDERCCNRPRECQFNANCSAFSG